MDARDLIAEVTKRNSAHYQDSTLLASVDNWDSLKGVQLVLRIEQITNRQLSEEEIASLHSVGDVGRYLGARG